MTTRTPPALSPRHLPVIAGLARGHSHMKIAGQLSISYDTVKSRIQEISRTAGVRGTPAIVNWAYQHGHLDSLQPEPCSRPARLGPSDVEVLRLMAYGRTNRQIAADLDVSFDRVRSHIERIYLQLCTDRRHHAVALGWQQGLLGTAPGQVAA